MYHPFTVCRKFIQNRTGSQLLSSYVSYYVIEINFFCSFLPSITKVDFFMIPYKQKNARIIWIVKYILPLIVKDKQLWDR